MFIGPCGEGPMELGLGHPRYISVGEFDRAGCKTVLTGYHPFQMKFSLFILTLTALFALSFAIDVENEQQQSTDADNKHPFEDRELTPEEKEMEEEFSKLFADGRQPTPEEMKEVFKKMFGDIDMDKLFADMGDLDLQEDENAEL